MGSICQIPRGTIYPGSSSSGRSNVTLGSQSLPKIWPLQPARWPCLSSGWPGLCYVFECHLSLTCTRSIWVLRSILYPDTLRLSPVLPALERALPKAAVARRLGLLKPVLCQCRMSVKAGSAGNWQNPKPEAAENNCLEISGKVKKARTTISA